MGLGCAFSRGRVVCALSSPLWAQPVSVAFGVFVFVGGEEWLREEEKERWEMLMRWSDVCPVVPPYRLFSPTLHILTRAGETRVSQCGRRSKGFGEAIGSCAFLGADANSGLECGKDAIRCVRMFAAAFLNHKQRSSSLTLCSMLVGCTLRQIVVTSGQWCY